MRKILFLTGALLATQALAAPKLQNSDFATPAQIISAGGTASQVLNTSNIWNDIDGNIIDTQIAVWNAKQAAISTSSAVSNQFLTGFTSPNTFTRAQPAFSDLSGSIAAGQISDATVIGKVLTGFSAGAGTVSATDTILQAFNKIVGNISAKLTSTLTSAHIFVGNASNAATDVAVSGDVTLANTGAFSLVNASVTGQPITGYTSGAGTVSATDTILQAIQKLNGNSAAVAGAVTSVGAFGSTPNANGASISSNVLTLQPASGTQPGGVSTAAQTFAGAKTFSSQPNFSSLTASLPLQLDGSKNVTSGAIDLSGSQVTSTLTVPNGGLGAASLTAYGVVIGGTTSTGAVQSVAVGTSGQVLTSNGAGAAPTFQAAGGGSGIPVYTAVINAPSGGSCTVASQGGSSTSWISGTPSSPQTGECDITIAGGIFSATPVCQFTAKGNSGNYCGGLLDSSTAIRAQCWSTSATTANNIFFVTCSKGN